jgi:signal transduction histidine kinase
VQRKRTDPYQAWLTGEILLLALLAAALALFLTNSELRSTYELAQFRLVLDTTVTLAAAIVAVLANLRFSVEGRRLDLLLGTGFFVAAAGTLCFSIIPVLAGDRVQSTEAWAGVGARLMAAALIAAAPFSKRRIASRERAMLNTVAGFALLLTLLWIGCRSLAETLPVFDPTADDQPLLLSGALSVQALLSLVALIGFGLRYRSRGEDLDRWLALAATLAVFAELHYVFTPVVSNSVVSQGDFLRLLSYGVLLVGVWHAIRFAEFGRAVAEERARVAREIHDGLAQYLFAISTHVSMLQGGAHVGTMLPRLKEAAAAAQQEARFAVLALSSASGTAPFDAALRRYVEFLTADGALEVDVEIDPDIHLAPDEQIEVFRIVQEGLGNVRRHARARRAAVRIVEDGGRRLVSVTDDGAGFDTDEPKAGQGLKNISERAKSIEGGFRLRSEPGRGTAVEVVLRT